MGTFFRITIVAGQFRTTVRYITCTAGISQPLWCRKSVRSRPWVLGLSRAIFPWK